VINKIKKTIASANINFLLGSGLSSPFLEILGDIENKLTTETDPDEIIKIKQEYFNKSISKNLVLVATPSYIYHPEELGSYIDFYKLINQLVLKRESTLLSRQINVFTTNIDIFSEVALEETGIEFNDGFHGRFNPKYDVGNFKKSYFKTSLHYENKSEIPVFNILKLHGSVSWKANDRTIQLDRNLETITAINEDFDKFDELMIVNPTKEKFKDTTLNQTYYDLLRIYSNELEKENSVLFVMGFSFADEHIRDLTIRVANTNPTLKIYILSYGQLSTPEYSELEAAKNKNVEVLFPAEGKNFDFQGIIELFNKVINDDVEVELHDY
jgi:hypothetical protein